MEDDGFYVPSRGEYAHPRGEYFLDYPRGERHDNHFVRGAFMYHDVISSIPTGTVILMELVPEPGNPYDSWAVAVHCRGQRIGYIASDTAGSLHEYVVGHNRRGRAVYAQGEIEDADASRVIVHIPWWRDQGEFREDSGVVDECRELLGAVSADTLQRIMITSQHLEDQDVALLHELKDAAPSLHWSVLDPGEIPDPLRFVLIDMDKQRKAELKAERIKARDVERAAVATARREAEPARVARDQEICNLAADGQSATEISRQVGCSETSVRKALKAAGMSVRNANDVAVLTRLRRAKTALQMQDDGASRSEIAHELACSVDTLKVMLRDIKFLQSPYYNPNRRQRALQVQELDSKLTLQQAADELGWSTKEVKSARSDAKMLADHPFESIKTL